MKIQKRLFVLMNVAVLVGASLSHAAEKKAPGRKPAQVRATGFDCSGTESGNTVKLMIKKVANYYNGSLSLSFSASVSGTIDGEAGSLEGGWSGSVDPKSVKPISPTYTYVVKESGDEVSIATVDESLKSPTASAPFPGMLVSVKVKTKNPKLPYLIIKAIHADAGAAEISSLTASTFISNGKQSSALGQLNLSCKSLLSE